MKIVILIIGVLLQFSSAGFSQNVQKASSNIRIIPIVNPVAILRIHSSPAGSINITNSNGTISAVDNARKQNQVGKIVVDSSMSNYNTNVNTMADCKGRNCNSDNADTSDK